MEAQGSKDSACSSLGMSGILEAVSTSGCFGVDWINWVMTHQASSILNGGGVEAFMVSLTILWEKWTAVRTKISTILKWKAKHNLTVSKSISQRTEKFLQTAQNSFTTVMMNWGPLVPYLKRKQGTE